jgi:transcriptional regulator with XRE-family HTH domain
MRKARARDVVGVGEVSPGDRLRAIRELAEMTQVEFGQLVGIAQGDISAMEHGKTPIGLRTATKITTALNLPVTRLIAEEDMLTLRIREALEALDSDELKLSTLEAVEALAKMERGDRLVIEKRAERVVINDQFATAER